MCLKVIGDNKIKVAEEDILVYKVVWKNSDHSFKTLYYKAEAKLGNRYESELNFIKPSMVKPYNYGYVYEGLHSFLYPEDAFDELVEAVEHDLSSDIEDVIAIVECTVPKGAKYYRGIFGDAPCIASDTLIYKQVAEWTTSRWEILTNMSRMSQGDLDQMY